MRRFVVGAVAWAIAGVAFAQGIEASIEKRPGGEDLVIQFPESMQVRNHRWVPLADTALQEGDWVRVTLAVTTTRQRHFVAVTDDLPGGLRPMDLQLAGVAGVDVQALGDLGDPAFDQRKLDARKPKFYAEVLRPGRHEIHYFARVANTGDYLAAPALAELMYGEATRARTASDRIRIEDPPTP